MHQCNLLCSKYSLDIAAVHLAITYIDKELYKPILKEVGNNRPGIHYFSSKKEVFQPHLPVRLPCYDLAPVTDFTLGSSFRLPTLGTPSFHGLTGGVCKVRERIHRIIADIRLLAIPASRSRVADFDPN